MVKEHKTCRGLAWWAGFTDMEIAELFDVVYRQFKK
jgi:hypothetical protein